MNNLNGMERPIKDGYNPGERSLGYVVDLCAQFVWAYCL